MLASRSAAPSGVLRQRRIHFPNKQPELTETPPSAPPPPPPLQQPPPLPPPPSFPPRPATAQAQRLAPPLRSRGRGQPRPLRAHALRMRPGRASRALTGLPCVPSVNVAAASPPRPPARKSRRAELRSKPNCKKPRVPEKPGRGPGRTRFFIFKTRKRCGERKTGRQ